MKNFWLDQKENREAKEANDFELEKEVRDMLNSYFGTSPSILDPDLFSTPQPAHVDTDNYDPIVVASPGWECDL